MDKIVESKAKKMVTIQTESDGKTLNDFSDTWLHNDYFIYKQYWLYNYTNYQDVLTKNAKPILTEKGPYSYREKWTYLYDIPSSFTSKDEEFTYKKNITYTFDQGTSCSSCSPSDTFYLPDIIFSSVADQLFDPVGFCMQLYDVLHPIFPFFLQPLSSPDDCLGEVNGLFQAMSLICPDQHVNFPSNLIQQFSQIFSELALANGVSPFMQITANDLLYDGYRGIYPKLLNGPILDILANFSDTAQECTNLTMAINLPVVPSVSIIQKDKAPTAYTVNTGINDYLLTGTMAKFDDIDTLPMGQNGSSSWWTDYQCGNVSDTTDVLYTTQVYKSSTMMTYANISDDYECTICTNDTAFEASRLHGSNGDFFHALLKKSTVLPTFIEETCRSLNLIYQQESTVKDIDAYRFIIDPNTFKTNEPGNCGYCRQLPRAMYGREMGSYCLPDGLIDLSGCEQENAEIVISNPHFLNVDQAVKDMFPTIKSNPDSDMTTVDIEPTTGTVLAANKRMQINFIVKNYTNTPWENITSGVYPMLWQNESFLIGPNALDQLKKNVVNPQNLVKLLCYIVGVGVGSLLMVISIISTLVLFLYFGKRRDAVKFSSNGQYINTTDSWGSPGHPASTDSGSIPRAKRKD
uniref:CD36 family protein n=1 Tax=Acrobeloides nanus TaxID=290746 RepID=A0A914DAM1_9BILA